MLDQNGEHSPEAPVVGVVSGKVFRQVIVTRP